MAEHTLITRKPKWPLRWGMHCTKLRLEGVSRLTWFDRTRPADRPWREELSELRIYGFAPVWDSVDVVRAREMVCEFCGQDMDLRAFSEPALGKHTYAYCTFKGCHWWLEF
jgi:hypothetical protein